MPRQSKAYLLAAATILAWSTVATAFKIALDALLPEQLLLVASVTSFLFLFLYAGFAGKLKLIRSFSSRDWFNSAILGFINPFLYYLILFRAYDNLPAQVAQPLNMIWPIVLVLISIPLLKQKVKPLSLLAMLISFGGIVLVSSQGGGKGFDMKQLPFMLLAVSTSVLWAVYWILNLRDSREESLKLMLCFGFALLYLAMYFAIVRTPLPSLSPDLLPAVYIGLFEMGLAFLMWLTALRYSRSTDRISNLVFIFPFISLIFIHYILGEKIYLTTLYGLILVIAGIILQGIINREKK